MNKKIKTRPIIIFSLDALGEKMNQNGNLTPFEYKIGAYYEMDIDLLGEMANIRRLLKNGLLSSSEEKAINKTMDDQKLNQSERKAKQRGLQRLRNILLRGKN